jgi:preprotein translocase subunit SecD
MVSLAWIASLGCLQNPPDIQKEGGHVLVYKLMSPDKDQTPLMVRALEQRLDPSGTRGIRVRSLDQGQIEISIPGSDPAQLGRDQRLITANGHLQFLVVAQRGFHDELIELVDDQPEAGEREVVDERGELRGQWAKFNVGEESVRLPEESVQRQTEDGAAEVLLVVEGPSDLDGRHLSDVRAAVDEQGHPCVAGEFNAEGAALMNWLTSINLPERGRHQLLAIVLDDQVITAPRIISPISSRFHITGRFSQEEIDFLVAVLRAGRLPGRLDEKPISVRKVAPQ